MGGPFRTGLPVTTVAKVTVVTGLFRRARTPVIARRVALAVAAIVVAGSVAATPAVASPGPTDPGADQSGTSSTAIDTTQAQVDADRGAVRRATTVAGSSCPNSTTRPPSVSGRSTRNCRPPTRRLAVARQVTRAARHALQVAAVNAYIFDTPSGELSSVFSALVGLQLRSTTSTSRRRSATSTPPWCNFRRASDSSARPSRHLHAQLQQASGASAQVGTEQQAAQATASGDRGDARRGEGPPGAARGPTCRRAGRGRGRGRKCSSQ